MVEDTESKPALACHEYPVIAGMGSRRRQSKEIEMEKDMYRM
tara:strand:+ start:485 stop:610 length:126 start_codon:yes stop_codon:yes gene_type:complete